MSLNESSQIDLQQANVPKIYYVSQEDNSMTNCFIVHLEINALVYLNTYHEVLILSPHPTKYKYPINHTFLSFNSIENNMSNFMAPVYVFVYSVYNHYMRFSRLILKCDDDPHCIAYARFGIA